MKPCVLYISRTGNTKRFAESIAELLKASIFDITSLTPSAVADFDLLAIGTPVMGMNPAPEVTAFVKRLPEGNGKKAIVFCTYAVVKGGTLKVIEKELAAKGYITILRLDKKGIKPDKADFLDALNEISRTLERQARS
jgi:flavodoxin